MKADHDAAVPSPDDAVILLARRLPKAELHMHLTGSLAPSDYLRLRTASTGERPSAADLARAYDNLGAAKFFADLDVAAGLWRDAEGLERATAAALDTAFDRGARHIELLCTPALSHSQAGLSVRETLGAVDRAFAAARERLGVSGGIVVELHRPDGDRDAVSLVEESIALRAEGMRILGIGSDGDHRSAPLSALQDAYRRAKDAGLRITGHVMSAAETRLALDWGFDRLDHGWPSASSPSLVAAIAASGAAMTFTPMAYVLGGHPASLPWHEAYRILSDAEIDLVIGTDDPALHHTDLTHSYEIVARRVGWGRRELAEAARRSFRQAWVADGDAGLIAAHLDEIALLERDPWGAREHG